MFRMQKRFKNLWSPKIYACVFITYEIFKIKQISPPLSYQKVRGTRVFFLKVRNLCCNINIAKKITCMRGIYI